MLKKCLPHYAKNMYHLSKLIALIFMTILIWLSVGLNPTPNVKVMAQEPLERFYGSVSTTSAYSGTIIIIINGLETTTTTEGFFELYVPRTERYIINVKAPGFIPLSKIHYGPPPTELALTLKTPELFSVDPANGVNVEDSRGTQIVIPPNSLVDQNGNPPPGPITLQLQTYNLTQGEEIPGDYDSINSDGNSGFLVSGGAFYAEFVDNTGNIYNLAPDATAEISIPVINSNFPDDVDLWSYDYDQAVWVEEGQASKVNGRYVGTVSHFSVWNFDWEKQNPACVKVEIDPTFFYSSGLAPFNILAKVTWPGLQARNLSLTTPGPHVLLNLPAGAIVEFYLSNGSGGYQPYPFQTINTGLPWGGTGVPPYPYTLCNGQLTINGFSNLQVTQLTPPATIYVGDSVDINLIARGWNIYGVQATCTATANVLNIQDGLFTNLFNPNRLIGIDLEDVPTNSWLGALAEQSPDAPFSGAEQFADLTYQAVNPGTATISCLPIFSDNNGFEISSTTNVYSVTVINPGFITGTLAYQGRLTHADIKVNASSGSTSQTDLTDSLGNFNINPLSPGSYAVKADVHAYLPNCTTTNVTAGNSTILTPSTLKGGDVAGDNSDANGDGDYGNDVINIGDLTGLSGVYNTSNFQFDINADGIINVLDLTLIGSNYGANGCQAW